MQPITLSNIAAHDAETARRLAAGTLAIETLHRKPKKRPVSGAAILSAMVDTILDIGEGCTLDDLRSRFTDAEIETHHKPAFARAKARARLN